METDPPPLKELCLKEPPKLITVPRSLPGEPPALPLTLAALTAPTVTSLSLVLVGMLAEQNRRYVAIDTV